MKLGPAVIGIIIAGGLGYLLEPSVRPALLPPPKKSVAKQANEGKSGEEGQMEAPPAIPVPAADPSSPAAPEWVAALTPEQLPAKVKLKDRAIIPVKGSSEPMTLPAGVDVTPVRVEGNDLVISPFGGPIEGKVAVMSTNLVEVLGSKPPEAPAPEVAVVETSNPEMADPPKPETPDPVVPPVAEKSLTPDEIVAVMQESVKAGEIKEFTFDQVLDWKAAEDKESGGETYQSGLASYKAETIFGVKNIQAQALIKDGKIDKWIWPKSGMEIK